MWDRNSSDLRCLHLRAAKAQGHQVSVLGADLKSAFEFPILGLGVRYHPLLPPCNWRQPLVKCGVQSFYAGENVDPSIQALANRIMALLEKGPVHFEEVLICFEAVPYRDILRAWGKLRQDNRLGREFETGKYLPRDQETAGRDEA